MSDSENAIPVCPHCGETGDVYRELHATAGMARQDFDSCTGLESDFSTENVEFGNAGSLRCCTCGAFRTDIKVVNDKVEVRA